MADSTDLAQLLALQAPFGVPESSQLTSITDPLLPPSLLVDIMAHFPDTVYDKRSHSHLSRFVKALIGQSGAGILRKHYAYSHLSSVLYTSNFSDLDRLYGDIFGFSRLSSERLDFDPWHETADSDHWQRIAARDAAYRSRIEEFSRAIALGGTPSGMTSAAYSIVGVECRLYETYTFVDQNGGNPGGNPPAWDARSYLDLEQKFQHYLHMEDFTYGELETDLAGAQTNDYGQIEADFGNYGTLDEYYYSELEGSMSYFGRTTSNNRKEFIIRPTRYVSAEEHYKLIKVLSRLKPADSLLTVDTTGVQILKPVDIGIVSADSTYWKIVPKVSAKHGQGAAYQTIDEQDAVEQPKLAFTNYQGEVWTYNSDVARVRSYAEDDTHTVVQSVDYQVLTIGGQEHKFTPDKGLTSAGDLLRGRYSSDGIYVGTVRT